MPAEERQLCAHCSRTVTWSEAKCRWVHEDTGKTWCARTGVKYAEPRHVG